ncbi:MAG: YggS family pyridoxal phosphate-dependent enzyme [Actinobacteria bacterium]|nr:YggS family pyridoxal phosphate-dependent enzyme [Actinomycetota bacterium]
MAAACAVAGRAPESVLLVAVTKAVPAAAVRQALALGLTDFGENRVQEAQTKIPIVAGGVWHLVGALQRNKARPALELFRLIHSLDSEALARRLDTVRAGRAVEALIQVNVTATAGQGGVQPEGLRRLATQVDRETGLRLRGLMTIGPLTHDPAALRCCFARLRELRDGLRPALPHQPFMDLSMGMTNDFEWAVVEGATMVRLGRAIFGGSPPYQGASPVVA